MLNSFQPIVGSVAQILILGTMPGAKSLQHQRYYAHPQNAFWWIMSELHNGTLTGDYTQRVEKIRLSKFAVWDVLAKCQRQGSLDSDINRLSEQPNDLPGFFAEHKHIHLVGFNGIKAKQIFYRHFSQQLLDQHGISNVLLPSTSPANAHQNRQQKLQQWQSLLIGSNS